jgi:hypothetical protein
MSPRIRIGPEPVLAVHAVMPRPSLQLAATARQEKVQLPIAEQKFSRLESKPSHHPLMMMMMLALTETYLRKRVYADIPGRG